MTVTTSVNIILKVGIMPLFRGSDCPKKVIGFAIIAILAISIIATMTFTHISIYFGIGIIVLSTVVLWYILDQFGDRLFEDENYFMSQEEIEKFGKNTIPLTRKEKMV